MNNGDELDRVRRLDDQRAAGEPPDEEIADVTPLQPPSEPTPLPPEMVATFGAQFFPQPFSYVITRGTYQDKPCLWVTFEHAHGRIAFPFSDMEMSGFVNRAQQMSNGLVVARDIPKL